MRSMFVSRSSFENPRPFERCVRTTSPSRYSTRWPRRRPGPTISAIVVLPAPDRPVQRARLGLSSAPRSGAVWGKPRRRWFRQALVSSHRLVCPGGCRTRACPSRPSVPPAPLRPGRSDGARHAADRPVAGVMKRVERDLVDVDVQPDRALVPVGERVHLPDAVALRPLQPASRRGSGTGRAGSRRSKRRTASARRVAARPCGCGSSGPGRAPEVRALLLVLLGDGDHRRGRQQLRP